MGCLAVVRLSILETLRRKELYVVLVIVLLLAVWMQSMSMGTSGAGRFAKDVVMQVIWLASFGLAAPVAARQIASDIEQKTIFVLMSRPIHRWQYVFGRAAGASASAIICFSIFFLVLMVMLMLKGSSVLADVGLWQAYVLQIAALIMLCSIVTMFSTTFSSAGAVTFSLIILAAMRYGGPSILRKVETMHGGFQDLLWAVYVAMPHFEFFNIAQRVVHGWGPLPCALFLQILAYGIGYSIFVSAFGALLFRRKWL